MSSDEELRTLIREEDANARQRVEHAAELGGPSVDADASALQEAMNATYDVVEHLSWRVEGVGECEGLLSEPEQPFTLTLEHVGVLAVVADDVDRHVSELQAFGRMLRRGIGAFDSIRRTQREHPVQNSHYARSATGIASSRG